MANYYGAERTNYFKVKDPVAFLSAMGKWPVDVVETDDGLFALFPDPDSDDGCFNLIDEQDDDYVWVLDLIWPHLADDSVAVLISVGHERLRYLHGGADAINSKGETVSISTRDIYDLAAKKFGIEPTQATY